MPPEDQHPEAAAMADALDVLPSRVRSAAMLRGLGYSLREIGALYGISSQAVSIMLIRHRRVLFEAESAGELVQLSSRAASALSRHGIRTRREAHKKDILALLCYERNCGDKTRREIARWLDETPDHRKPLSPSFDSASITEMGSAPQIENFA